MDCRLLVADLAVSRRLPADAILVVTLMVRKFANESQAADL